MNTTGKNLQLVLVPGFMTDVTLWQDMQPALQSIGPLTYADLNSGNTIQEIASRILVSCPPQFVLIGFSLGGYIARQMLRIAPDRVQALMLIASSLRPDTAEQKKSKETAVQALSNSGFGGLSRQAIRLSLHPDQSHNEALLERVKKMGLGLGKEAFIRQSLLERADDSSWLHQVACPTLVIGAENDQLRSLEETKELAEAIPGSVCKIIKDSGHMIPLEQPKALSEMLLAWLENLPFKL